MKWMSSDFASWQVEGQVMERIDNALKDGENWRHAKQAQSARNPRKGSQKSTEIDFSWLYRINKGVRQFLKAKFSVKQPRPTQWNARVQR
jgi:hypothetical protein